MNEAERDGLAVIRRLYQLEPAEQPVQAEVVLVMKPCDVVAFATRERVRSMVWG